MKRSIRTLALAAALLTAACKGDAGPMGPSGAQGPPGPTGPGGPTGPAGPGTRVVLTSVVNSSGAAAANLPAAAASGTNLPAMSCYLNQPGTTSYLLIGLDLDGPVCGLVRTPSGTYQATMIDAVPGWNAYFVVVY